MADKVLGTQFIQQQATVDQSVLEGVEAIGLYFSAHWCPPCRSFTPLLAEFYEEVNKDKKIMEIIFVSADKKDNEFQEYYGSMPWLTFPFGDERIKKLFGAYEIAGIPALVILDKNGNLITKEGRNDVMSNPTEAISKWIKK